jgi:hypothetical protein
LLRAATGTAAACSSITAATTTGTATACSSIAAATAFGRTTATRTSAARAGLCAAALLGATTQATIATATAAVATAAFSNTNVSSRAGRASPVVTTADAYANAVTPDPVPAGHHHDATAHARTAVGAAPAGRSVMRPAWPAMHAVDDADIIDRT